MRHLNVEVLVVGAGPAGLAAAAGAAGSRATIGLIDDNPNPGGQIWRGGPHAKRPDQAARRLRRIQRSNIHLLTQTRVIAAPEAGRLIAETATGPLALSYQRLIIASGARELFLPFPGWTLPGVLGAGGLQALVKGGLPIENKRVVVAGSGPLLLAVAAYLAGKGANVQAVVEQAPWRKLVAFSRNLLHDPEKMKQAVELQWRMRRVPFRAGSWVIRAQGTDRLQAVTVQQGGRTWTKPCDYLACGFGLIPNPELPYALGCAVVKGALQVDQWQQTSRTGIYGAGEVTGIGGLEAALVEGRIAGLAATGQTAKAEVLFPIRARAQRFAGTLAQGFALRDELKNLADPDTLICRCEDVPYHALQRHGSWRGAKLQTRCGMGPCQGRVCGGAAAFLFGWTQDSVRSPITPCPLGSLAQVGAPPTTGEKVRQ
jgi:NADPH-dependent 2,4-dienoyl-CoA reductase/sulfur reductase-like enzyme